MKSLRNMNRAGWIIAGVLAVAVVAPSAAIATTAAVTEIRGPGGQRAAVTNAGQLTTTPAAPSTYEDRLTSADAPSSTDCENLPSFSSTAGFIVTEIVIDAYDVSGPADNTAVAVFLGPNCSVREPVQQVNPATDGATVMPLTPGLTIPAKGTISFEVLHEGALVTAYGYTVPAKDAPHYSGTN